MFIFQVGVWDGDEVKLNKSLVEMYDRQGELIFPPSQCPGMKCNCSARYVSSQRLEPHSMLFLPRWSLPNSLRIHKARVFERDGYLPYRYNALSRINYHNNTLYSGGSKGAPGTPPGLNCFIFMQFLAKTIGTHNHFGSWRAPRKILDPPLL